MRRKLASRKGFSQHCLNAKGQAIAPYEAEMDTIVAQPYGLTDAELAIIGGRDNYE